MMLRVRLDMTSRVKNDTDLLLRKSKAIQVE